MGTENDLGEVPIDTLLYEKMNQIPLSQLLKKFDKEVIHEKTPLEYFSAERRRRFKIVQMPSFLVLNIHRFKKNSFFWEKNFSIVNFPIKNFDIKDISPLLTQKTITFYNLIATYHMKEI